MKLIHLESGLNRYGGNKIVQTGGPGPTPYLSCTDALPSAQISGPLGTSLQQVNRRKKNKSLIIGEHNMLVSTKNGPLLHRTALKKSGEGKASQGAVFKVQSGGFPGGSVGKNLPAFPDPGRSHMPQSNQTQMPQLLSLCCRTHTLQLLKPHPRDYASQQEKSLQWGAHALPLKSGPCSPQLEKKLAQQ